MLVLGRVGDVDGCLIQVYLARKADITVAPDGGTHPTTARYNMSIMPRDSQKNLTAHRLVSGY